MQTGHMSLPRSEHIFYIDGSLFFLNVILPSQNAFVTKFEIFLFPILCYLFSLCFYYIFLPENKACTSTNWQNNRLHVWNDIALQFFSCSPQPKHKKLYTSEWNTCVLLIERQEEARKKNVCLSVRDLIFAPGTSEHVQGPVYIAFLYFFYIFIYFFVSR